MRTESANHLAARTPRKTRPVYFARFFHIEKYGSANEYAFSADFASGAVTSSTKNKLLMLEAIDGAFAQCFPEQGRASLGSISLTLTNATNLAMQYIGMLRATLGAAMTPSSPGVGGFITLSAVTANIPASGTLEITTGGVIERIRYANFNLPDDQVEVVARGVDGTTAASHAIGDEVTNGEQIRPGQRCQIYAGYAGLAETDYMPFQKMEVVGRRLHEDGEAFVIELADIQRTLRREIFLTASETAPVLFAGDPFQLLLEVLHSTGLGTNGVHDVLPETWGIGIPAAYVDTTAIQNVSAAVDAPDFSFDIRAPVTAKDWIEKEILQVCNAYPYVTQDGKYSCRRLGGLL